MLASRAELAAPVAYPGVPSQVVDFASSVRPAGSEVILVEETGPSENACWIPVSDRNQVQQFVDNVILDKTLVRTVRIAPLPTEIIRQVSEARQAYWDLIAAARQDWIANGRKTSPAVAEKMSQAREAFKLTIRKKYPVGGLAAKGVDAFRGGYAAYQAELAAEIQGKIAAGRSADVIASAFKTNALVDRTVILARTSLPVLKALTLGNIVVAAVDLPGHVSAMLSARTPAEYDKAFSDVVSVGSSAGLTAACLVFSLGTGGLAMLACGVAPVAAGFYGGEAALLIRDLVK